MQILLTNDDGIYAPGLAAMERELKSLGDVTVVAPAVEQSGVGHAITFLTPLVCNEAYDGDRRRGWSVEGSPADCVKIAVTELCGGRPDLVVSGINGGLNVGINVLYSGTVAAAIEGAFFGITSVAVSLEYEGHRHFASAARLAVEVIGQLLEHQRGEAQLFNVNIPAAALHEPSEVKIVPMDVSRYGERFEKRTDPRGRTYYWATGEPVPEPNEDQTDLQAITRGHVSVTPLDFDLTKRPLLEEMQRWNITLPPPRQHKAG